MIVQNLKYSLKALVRTPLVTITAVVALALGIGANTALFSVIDAVLLRPLDYPHPERIVELVRSWPSQDAWATSPPKFAFWQHENRVFDAVAAYTFNAVGLNLVGQGEPERLPALGVSAGYFQVLGVQPFLGRSWMAAEDKPGAAKGAVLSYRLWQRLFHGQRAALGQSLSLSSASYQIIGVMPKGFDSSEHAELWVPLQLKIDPSDRANDYRVIARLKPGVSLPMAQADLSVVGQRFRKTFGKDLMDEHETIKAIRFHDFLVDDAKRPLWILLVAVGFVLLIACANVANLLLARSANRQREMAVRVAVGASGAQIVKQLLIESWLLSFAGAACGCLLASAFLPLLLKLAPADIPQLTGATIDLKVLLYTLLVAFVTGTIFGIFPALQSARLGIANPLRDAGTRTTANAASQRARQMLVIAEVAITLLLLVGASLLIRTLLNLQAVEPGFKAQNVLTLEMSLDDKYSSGSALASLTERVTRRLLTVPGVKFAATGGLLPLSGYMDLPFEIVGRPAKPDDMPDERYRFISPRYMVALSIPVRSGREFDERDTAKSAPVMLVNDAFASKYFPKQNPIGQQILVGRIMGPVFADQPRRIVGVVGSTRDEGLGRPAPPEMFEPEAQVPTGLLKLDISILPLKWVIRTSRDPLALAGIVRREALTVAGDLPMSEPKPLAAIISDSLARQRFVVTLLGVFAGIALLLGTVGLYGVISYSVAQRTREMGIRSALGAQRANLLRLVVGNGMWLAGWGLLAGLLASLALTRFLRSLLFGVSPADPLLLAGVTALLGMVALAACFLPAWRASRVDPVTALRQE